MPENETWMWEIWIDPGQIGSGTNVDTYLENIIASVPMERLDNGKREINGCAVGVCKGTLRQARALACASAVLGVIPKTKLN